MQDLTHKRHKNLAFFEHYYRSVFCGLLFVCLFFSFFLNLKAAYKMFGVAIIVLVHEKKEKNSAER